MKRTSYWFWFSAIIVFVASESATAQFAVVDNMGQPIQTKSYTDVQGSPYLYDNWQTGVATTRNGVTYDEIELMYDLVTDELIFKGKEGKAQSFIQPIFEFRIKSWKNELFRNGYQPIDKANTSSFYEVLADGQAQLLKRTYKRMFEEVPYGTATKVKSFQSNSSLYIARDNKLTKIKTDEKAVLRVIGDKQEVLKSYIKAQSLNLKEESDLAALIGYYNSLR